MIISFLSFFLSHHSPYLTSYHLTLRQRLKSSLDIATLSQDNHLRALVIALTSAHYVHTASGHAGMMLDTARQLAAGMGALSSKSKNTGSGGAGEALGNAPLGLWIGEKFHGEGLSFPPFELSMSPD